MLQVGVLFSAAHNWRWFSGTVGVVFWNTIADLENSVHMIDRQLIEKSVKLNKNIAAILTHPNTNWLEGVDGERADEEWSDGEGVR